MRGHFVQFYEGEQFLCDTVTQFFTVGLQAGERLLLIAEPSHVRGILAGLRAGFDAQLAPDPAAALRSGQLTVVDARELLDTFLVDGMPDAARFHAQLGRLLLPAPACVGTRVRAFGEMVNLLWADGNARAALHLEELWNEAGEKHEFSLLCGYGLHHFSQQRDGTSFEQVCHLHTHVIPTEGFLRHGADERLREISILQQRANALETEIRQRRAVERALRQVLETRARVEAELRASLEREQAARSRAQANDAFKEAFMGILGRELRQPLDTMLATARLMTLRGELSADGQTRLERVLASGVRMQRMLDQMLDLARDRWAAGISVSRTAARDLVPLVAKIVDEMRHAHPRLQIQLRGDGCCVASVDADRFEQVVAHLLSNAATHGDGSRPIQVVLERSGWDVSFSVHNYGRPIAPEALPLLFEPQLRPRKQGSRAAGLGLGLYICERVVRAHGGVLRVASSEHGGTLFVATLPRCAEAAGSA